MRDYKILVVDYEPRGIQQLREPLEAEGFDVEVVKDGLTALEVFNRYKPHLTLIEAMLPKKHGFEVCQDLKKTPHGVCLPCRQSLCPLYDLIDRRQCMRLEICSTSQT